MKAIALTRQNREKIIEEDSGVAIRDIDLNTERHESLFFVVLEGGWMFIRPDAFGKYFKQADMMRMSTEFVNVEFKESP